MTNTESKIKRIKELIFELNDASKNYYEDIQDPIPDILYDKKFIELVRLENETGTIFPDSPSNKVGSTPTNTTFYPHYKPVLSLKDTKSVDEMLYFLAEHEGVLSWKLDGISIILQYMDGVLINALTRGDGKIGKVIFKNVLNIPTIPKQLTSKVDLIVRGEGCVSLKEFDTIKKSKSGERYSNPRNLVAGIMHTNNATKDILRRVHFIAHSLIEVTGKAKSLKKRSEQLLYLKNLGFEVVDHTKVLNFQLIHEIEKYTKKVDTYSYPVDGLVLTLDDIEYGESLGSTLRFPRHSLAFKWPDISTITKVKGMKWSVSKTGLITPVVIFEPVELEGTTVQQANLHNLKMFEKLKIGKDDILKVYKANKVIPEVEENLSRTGTEEPPIFCPICNAKTEIVENERTKKLYCVNEECESRL